jgi:hypothetical protein
MSIRFESDVVIKTGTPALIEVEAIKLIAARKIGEETGLFVVPEILDLDPIGGRMVMRRLHGIRGVRQRAIHSEGWHELAGLIGRSLAAIHGNLRLPEALKVELPCGLEAEYANAFLHGDFSGENVCVAGGRRLVILDWQMSPRYGGVATYGPRYFDVCWFLCNVFRRPPHVYLAPPFPWNFATSFVQAYADASGAEFDRKAFLDYHVRFFDFRTKNQTGAERAVIKRILLAPGYLFWNRFMLGGYW